MRYIAKGREPECLAAFKADAANAPTEEDFARHGARVWGRFRDKRDLLRALLREQGWLCCYCQRRIAEPPPTLPSEQCHVEHLLPRAHFPRLMFEHHNVAASCEEGDAEAPRTPLHCGAVKADWPTPDALPWFVSPVDPTCESSFRYTPDGRIQPTDDPLRASAARETIDRLQLDIKLLRAQRRAAIEPFLDEVLAGTERDVVVDAVLHPSAQGHNVPFAGVIAAVLAAFG